MPKVRISAVRFASLLANRNLTPSDVATRSSSPIRADLLAVEDQDVEFDDLVVLAKFFKRPWSYLLIDEPEVFPDTGTDNRTFANRKVRLSSNLLAELQSADQMLESAAELFPAATFNVPWVANGDVSAGRLANDIRALLSVSVEEQLQIKDPYTALRRWVAAIHGQGVYVSQRKLKDPTIRAFSKVVGDQAIIVVDTSDIPYARIFSALHEYCHITLRSTGICDLDDHSRTERFCNQVAAEVLMPEGLIKEFVNSRTFAGRDEAADDALKSLSNQVHVSQAALLIRLRDMGMISQQKYEQMEMRRAARRSGGDGPAKGLYYPVQINRAGRLFAHRVVDAFADGAIDRQDASVLLDIGQHSVPRFVTELAKGD